MKKYTELTDEQKKKAVENHVSDILQDICNGDLRFNDKLNGDDLQARIDAAFERANKMQTPWFAHEYMVDDEYIKDCVYGMAQCRAEDTFYTDPGEFCSPVPNV